jgi:cobalt-zinc-cadmium efflux system protein
MQGHHAHGHHHHSHPGHDHSHHHHGHHHDAASALGWAVLVNLAFVIAEAIGGALADSTALWADATHNLSDVAGLLLAWGAARLARSPRTRHRTYGLKKTTLTAALLNAVLVLVAVIGVSIAAISRLDTPTPPDGLLVIAFALAGVLVNGGSAALFIRRKAHDINARAAYLHLVADALISLAVVINGALVLLTDLPWLDPVTSLLVSLLILRATWRLLRESLDLVLDAVPRAIDSDAVEAALRALPGVTNVHDLHVWALGSDTNALTAHLQTAAPSPGLLKQATETLRERFGIAHITLQIESPDEREHCGGCET